MNRIKEIFRTKSNSRRPKTKPKVLGVYWAIGLSSLFFLLSFSPFFEVFERKAFDQAMRLRGERSINPAIQIAEIDDKSIENFGRWPWPRGYHASFLQILEEYKPKVIGYDMLFSEQDLENPEEDIALAKKTRDIGSVVYPAYFVVSKDQIFQSKELKDIPSAFKEKFSLDYEIKNSDDFIKSFDVYFPIALLADSSFGIGHVNVPPDSDGVVRSIPLVIEFQGRLYPSFDLMLVSRYLGVKIEDIKVKPPHIILFRDAKPLVKIPIDRHGRMLISFSGKYEDLPRVSFSQIIIAYDQLKSFEPPIIDLGMFKNKIVLVGLSATGTTDIRATPFSEVFPGVGIHADVVNDILNNDFIIKTNKLIFGLILFLFAFLIGILVPRLSPIKSFVLTFSIVAAYNLANFTLFIIKGIWIGFFPSILAMLTTYGAVLLNQFIVSRFENQLIKNELTIASQIQQGMLPQEYPKIEGLDFYCLNKPAKFVGGDLYDFFLIDRDILAVAIGDVSGKGVPAALLMAKIIAHLRSAIGMHKDPGKVLSYINERLVAEGSSGLFVTMVYLVFDMQSHQLLFSNGGHHTMLCYNHDQNKFKDISEEKGMPVGLIPQAEFFTNKIKISSNDTFVLFTDGITEAVNKLGKEYEMDNFKETISKNASFSAKELTEKIINNVESFADKLVQHDDITAIVIKVRS